MDFAWHILALVGLTLPHTLAYGLVFGRAKIFHFGPMATSLVASYAAFIVLPLTGSFVLSYLACLGAALLISLFFAWLALRLPPDSFGVLSIAVHLAAVAIVLNWTDLTRGALGIPGIPRLSVLSSQPAFALAVLLLAAAYAACLEWLDRGRIGRCLSALSEHEWYASSMGVNRTACTVVAFLVAGVGSSITAFFYPQYIALLHPNDYLFPAFIVLMMRVVAGKPGNIVGTVIATVLLVLLQEGLRFVSLPPGLIGPVRLILFGLILFGVIWWRKDQLFPMQRNV